MKKNLMKKPMLLLAIAAVLLVASTVGSTQAALVYYSENYIADVEISNIGISLIENKQVINYRDYIDDGEWYKPKEATALMTNLLGEGEQIVPGKVYDEELKVMNSGAIDSYVRVIITKYWKDDQGEKAEDLNPAYIKLIESDSDNWMKSPESNAERAIYYYKNILPVSTAEQEYLTDALITDIVIDEAVAKHLIQTTDKNTNIITYEYTYDGCSFVVEAEAQAIQTHNAADAIKSAWGVNAVITDGKLEVR